MKRNILTCTALLLTVYLATLLPTAAFAYTPGPGYSGTPINYGGWLLGRVYIEIRGVVENAPWAKITVTGTDSSGKAVSDLAYSNGFGNYRAYLSPGNYTVTVNYAHYTQTYNVQIKTDQIYYLLNIYIERPDAGFKNYLS